MRYGNNDYGQSVSVPAFNMDEYLYGKQSYQQAKPTRMRRDAFGQNMDAVDYTSLDNFNYSNTPVGNGSGISTQPESNAFNMPSMSQIGDGISMFGDAYKIGSGLYDDFVTKPQMVGLAKEQMGLQKQAYNDNNNRMNNFIGGTQKAFG